jgi:hypothetical protein
MPAHDSGPMRIATPSLQWTYTTYSLPVLPAHHDCRMGELNTALGHHLHQISKAEIEPEIPADAEDDDLLVEMPALEKIVNILHSGSSNVHLRRLCPASAVCTRTVPCTLRMSGNRSFCRMARKAVSQSWIGRRLSSPAARQGRALARGLDGCLPFQHPHANDRDSWRSRCPQYFPLALKHGICRKSNPNILMV